MRKISVWPFVALLALAWLLMLMLSFYTSWLLLPDLLLVVVLALQLNHPTQLRWLLVLPFALMADVAAALPLGFHLFYDALVVLFLIPLGFLWPMISLLARSMLVIAVAMAAVLLKWLLVYMLTGEPAANGWWLSALFGALCWPFAQWLVWVWMPQVVEDGHD